MTAWLMNGAQARDRIIAKLRDLPVNQLWDVSVVPHRRRLTADQRALIFACVQQIAQARGEPYETVLAELKRDHWPHEWRIDLATGERRWVPKSLAAKPDAADRREVSDIINRLHAYCAEHGIILDDSVVAV